MTELFPEPLRHESAPAILAETRHGKAHHVRAGAHGELRFTGFNGRGMGVEKGFSLSKAASAARLAQYSRKRAGLSILFSRFRRFSRRPGCAILLTKGGYGNV